jgi:hypothetical protein
MALSEEIYNILNEFGETVKEDLQQSLRDKGVTFGGNDSRLSNSIKFDITSNGNVISFKLKMPEYGEAVDKGRRAAPVSEEGQKSISNWAKRKGIVGKFAENTLKARLEKQSKNKTDRKKKVLKKPTFDKSLKALTYLVSRKIKNKGYKGNNFYTSVVDDGRLDKLKKDLASVLKSEVDIEIIDLTKI